MPGSIPSKTHGSIGRQHTCEGALLTLATNLASSCLHITRPCTARASCTCAHRPHPRGTALPKTAHHTGLNRSRPSTRAKSRCGSHTCAATLLTPAATSLGRALRSAVRGPDPSKPCIDLRPVRTCEIPPPPPVLLVCVRACARMHACEKADTGMSCTRSRRSHVLSSHVISHYRHDPSRHSPSPPGPRHFPASLSRVSPHLASTLLLLYPSPSPLPFAPLSSHLHPLPSSRRHSGLPVIIVAPAASSAVLQDAARVEVARAQLNPSIGHRHLNLLV